MSRATCVLEEVICETLDLDFLASSLCDGNSSVFQRYDLCELIEGALEHLEEDDTISPSLTDSLVEFLVEAQEIYEAGGEPWEALDEFLQLYAEARAEKSLEELWMDRIGSVPMRDLRTKTWDQFLQAYELVEQGRGHLVESWLLAKMSEFQSALVTYSSLSVSPHEVTMESQMCHDFLCTGLQCWLNAVSGLWNRLQGRPGLSGLMVEAEKGQRLLMAVQIYEAEAALAESHYFVNFN